MFEESDSVFNMFNMFNMHVEFENKIRLNCRSSHLSYVKFNSLVLDDRKVGSECRRT